MPHTLVAAIGLGTLAVILPLSAAAQDAVLPGSWDDMPWVERGSFTLTGNDLTIQVDAESPGTLVVMRGQSSRVRIRARAEGGLAGFALPDRGRARLQLAGAAAGELTYLVVVPPRARVLVRLPDRTLPESLRTLQDAGTFRWEAPAPEAGQGPPPEAEDGPPPEAGEGPAVEAGEGPAVEAGDGSPLEAGARSLLEAGDGSLK